MLFALAYSYVINSWNLISKQNNAQRTKVSPVAQAHTCVKVTNGFPSKVHIMFRVCGPSCVDSVERLQAVAPLKPASDNMLGYNEWSVV